MKNRRIRNIGCNLYEWAMLQQVYLNGSKWADEASQFNEDFIESYNR